MCGINGINFVDRKLIKKMNDSLKHRGPDGEGVYFDERNGVSLGHRRLAIIDLSENGKQPMTYFHKEKKAVIVFNGEIYNFQEIREELIKKGYIFKSKTDTEVILASYFEWGFDCVNKFNGMWAFCIYDPQKKILFLSRDRVGKKPLHYYFDGKNFIFSSEIKGILQKNIKKEIDKNSIDLYFSLGFIPAPWTIYKKIFKLDARQNLIFYLKGNKIKKYYYYDWPEYEPVYNKEYLKKKIETTIEDAIKIRLIADVPLGAFLSGGLDSSTIIKKMSKFIKKENLNTYSIGFEGKFDETKYINIFKDYIKTKHHHKYFREEDFKKIIKKIFYFYDEPFSDPSMFPTFFLSEFTKKGLTVSLSGDGGDEIFGGYPRYRYAEIISLLKKIPLVFRKFLFYFPIKRIKEAINLSFLKEDRIYSEARKEIYKPEIAKKVLKEKLSECLKKTKGNLQEAIRLMDIYFYTLPENFLLKVDRASMANALEVRCPFLDYRLIELSMKIPTKWKCSFFRDKILFREIIKKDLPKQIIKRKKTGFTPPINKWINKKNYKEELKKIIMELEKTKIIDQKWLNFYKKIIEKDDFISSNYKIRLYFFYKWKKYWLN
ncbi:MAG: asparagine synthase (glutamine-hydrolyzing) [Candidatus Pacearchaeota archaeon]